MIELIPAIDIIDGKCVRLTQGDYATKKIYNEDPLEVAKMFEGNGIRRLHVVDLDGAREGRIINYRILERIATRTSLIIDFGGGLKQEDDLEIAFESGAQMVTGGSIAVKNPEMFTSWISKFGSEKIILGADAKETTPEEVGRIVEQLQRMPGLCVAGTATTSDGIERIIASSAAPVHTAARHQLKERTEKLNEFIAAELLGKAEVIGATKLIIDMQKGSSMNELKNLGDMLIRDENVLAMLFGENGDSLVYQLVRGRNVKTSMRELIKAVNAAAGGKGGGRDEYAQGSAKITSATDAEGSIESLRGYCRSMLKA